MSMNQTINNKINHIANKLRRRGIKVDIHYIRDQYNPIYSESYREDIPYIGIEFDIESKFIKYIQNEINRLQEWLIEYNKKHNTYILVLGVTLSYNSGTKNNPYWKDVNNDWIENINDFGDSIICRFESWN